MHIGIQQTDPQNTSRVTMYRVTLFPQFIQGVPGEMMYKRHFEPTEKKTKKTSGRTKFIDPPG